MKFTSTALALIVLAGTANAFQSPQASHSRHSASAEVRRSNSRIISSLNMAEEDGMSEVEKLRAAAAKAREEADKLSKVCRFPVKTVLHDEFVIAVVVVIVVDT